MLIVDPGDAPGRRWGLGRSRAGASHPLRACLSGGRIEAVEIARAAGYALRRRLVPPVGAVLGRTDAIETSAPDGPDPYGDADPAWLEIDWREHLHSVEIGGTPVTYVEIGEGRPILLIHGLSGSWQNWLENIPALANRGFRVLALDLPGFGASPMPTWPISVPAYGGLVKDFSSSSTSTP